ncbi:hypothetical protein CY34DRAFT_14848 [Suillus luteus UH-Slu-Lm8-n1]|uniref:C2H2-type domain-containing protein n=1 Tax=Suillus luteus UH-Slu-Lm8-n1 TaxID=930992 RepID=A0A0D0AAD0_9AGAM|nr:hypothetical protein CY34DRAFT_14848 [Suillus luteus UH-Slu-Lm8-n1]
MEDVYKEILEIRARITELLVTCQSETSMGDEGTLDNSVDFQAIVDDEPQFALDGVPPSLTPQLPILEEPQVFRGQLSGLEYGPSGFARTLPEGARLPIGILPGNLLFSGTNGVVSYGLGVPGFPPNYGTYSDGEMPSESSARRGQQPRFPVEQGGQDKVKCTWPGCSRAVKKDNLTRHVNEMHQRKVKAVCTGCRKGFSRPYMLKYHTCPAR